MAGGSNLGDEEDEVISAINVIPLVDIMLVLLVIFMVTTQFVQDELRNKMPPNVPIQLPKASSAMETNPSLLSIVVNQKAEIFLNGKLSSIEGIKSRVAELKKRGQKLEAIVAADKRLSHGDVLSVIDTLRVLGVPDVAVNTRRQEIE